MDQNAFDNFLSALSVDDFQISWQSHEWPPNSLFYFHFSKWQENSAGVNLKSMVKIFCPLRFIVEKNNRKNKSEQKQ